MRRIIPLVFVGVLVVVLGSSSAIEATEPLPTSEMRLLETTHRLKETVQASSGLVVWEDYRAGQGTPHLYGYDFKLKREVGIVTGPGVQAQPSMDGDRVVFKDFVYSRASKSDIHLYDHRTKTTSVVCDDLGDQQSPSISGDTVVWVSYPKYGPTQGDILGVNLATGERFVVEDSIKSVEQPDISGDWVVYSDFSVDRGGDVIAYNIRTQQRKTLASGMTVDQTSPSISDEGLVVWQERRGGDASGDIRGCYVNTGVAFDVAVGSGIQHNCTATGHLAVYNDESKPGGYHVVGYDRLSGKRFGIAPTGKLTYYVSKVNQGRMAWISTDDATSSSWVWIAHPTDLDLMSVSNPIDDAISQSRDSFAAAPSVPSSTVAAVSMAAEVLPASTPTVVAAPSGPVVTVTSTKSWQYPLIAQAALGSRSPLLLVTPTMLTGRAATELRRLQPRKVIIVGGTAAVSSGVQAQIASIVGAGRVTRINQTSARRAAIGVAQTRKARGGWNGTVLVVSQSRWAGAVTASSLSAARSYPMLLVGSTGFSAGELRALRALGIRRALIIGDTASVPARAASQLARIVGTSRVVRLAGKNRYATSAKVASWAVAHESMRWNRAGIISGESYTRSLLVGWSKGRTNSVLLMTDEDSLSPATASALRAHQRSMRSADFIGPRSVISKRVRGQVRMITR